MADYDVSLGRELLPGLLSGQDVLSKLLEMVVQGVSTRKVSAITEELCGASFSKSTVSARYVQD